MICVDLSQESSLETLKEWIDSSKNIDKVQLGIVGTKMDERLI